MLVSVIDNVKDPSADVKEEECFNTNPSERMEPPIIIVQDWDASGEDFDKSDDLNHQF